MELQDAAELRIRGGDSAASHANVPEVAEDHGWVSSGLLGWVRAGPGHQAHVEGWDR